MSACSSDDEADEPALTPTTVAATITTLDSTGGGDGEAAVATTTTSTTTTTTAPELSFPEYRIVSREAGENGDVVVVLLDTETYESLSDIDILNVMSDLVEQYAPVFEAHLVESQSAADALFVESPSEEEQVELDNRYIARLEQGFRIVYLGPYEESGVAILGS
jgi:hypothetical protein